MLEISLNPDYIETLAMAKAKSSFFCQNCGASYTKWIGKCDGCDEWNTITEEPQAQTGFFANGPGSQLNISNLQTTQDPPKRMISKNEEFDRVCGGGLVQGGVILIGGDPGIGKSTLLLQIAAKLSESYECLYISGEEALDQIQARAKRLEVSNAPLKLASSIQIKDILTTCSGKNAPQLLVIDSIQTMVLDTLSSAPGTVGQVRACSHELVTLAKSKNITILIVGHVTKEGTIAGPRVLEHMVDTVLYFEGERGHPYRILRTVKNRYGATSEIGLFHMESKGLMEVKNPSALFLSERREGVSGSSVYAGVEGTRPVLVEVQALLSKTAYGNPKRTVVGWDSARLSMLLAVLETRCQISFAQFDVYLNIAGGLKITDPGSDLAIAAALVSAFMDVPLDPNTIFIGEVGLSGEIRGVTHAEARLKEAAKLGFNSAITPKMTELEKNKSMGIALNTVDLLYKLVENISAKSPANKKSA